MSDPVLDAALEYAALGWPVFPCSPVTKQPMTEHGFKDAATDPQVISPVVKKEPQCDDRHGYWSRVGRSGARHRRRPGERLGWHGRRCAPLPGRIPEGAMCVRTPGGLHVWFQAPPEGIRKSAGRIGPGLDVRGDGGYVIVPPSVNGAGIAYKWDPWGALFPMEDWLRPKPKAAPPHQRVPTSHEWRRPRHIIWRQGARGGMPHRRHDAGRPPQRAASGHQPSFSNSWQAMCWATARCAMH